MPQINLRVEDETKREWEEYARESPKVQSLSGLIRLAVTNEIEGRESQSQPVRSGSIEEGRIEELEEQYSTIRNGLEDLTKQMKLLVDNVENQPSYSNMKGEIYAAIPEGKENAVTYDELDERLGEPITPTDVGHWVNQLVESPNQVAKIETEEGTKIYREQ